MEHPYMGRPVRSDSHQHRSYTYTTDSSVYRRELFLPEPVNKPTSILSIQQMERGYEKSVHAAKDESNFRNLLLKFMEYTSAHGIGRLAESKTIFWKLFWSLVCLGAFGMFIFQAYRLFMQYLSKPVLTSVKVTFEKQLRFPAVTICNLNMIRRDAIPTDMQRVLKESYQYGADWSAWSNNSGASDEGSGNFRSRKSARSDMPLTTAPRSDSDYYNSNDYKDYRDDSQSDRNYYPGYSQEGNEDIEEDYPDSNEVDEETKLRSRIAMLIGKLDPSDLYDNGHSFSDMIVNCTWKGQDCKSGNLSRFWKHSWNYMYGNCYTFNSGFDEENKIVRILRTSKPGPSQGKSVTK